MYFIRYEDLATDNRKALVESFKFIFGVESIEGTCIEKRMDDILGGGKAGFIYKPRSGKINLNSNQKYYSPEQLTYVLKMCKEYINFFGYAKVEGKENPFSFFDYENMTDSDV